jgi:hypothetical protein
LIFKRFYTALARSLMLLEGHVAALEAVQKEYDEIDDELIAYY